MGKVDIDVAYVAELARLELDASAKERLQKEMESILGYVEQLQELDVSRIEPTAHASQSSNVWRADETVTPYPREKMLANAPATVNGELIKVPQVLPGEEMS